MRALAITLGLLTIVVAGAGLFFLVAFDWSKYEGSPEGIPAALVLIVFGFYSLTRWAWRKATEGDLFMCPDCGEEFETLGDYEEHYGSVHET